ncbi:MAG: hypothetical protein ACEQSC_02505, partial [Candidatus Nanopelagicaceae bacterium]
MQQTASPGVGTNSTPIMASRPVASNPVSPGVPAAQPMTPQPVQMAPAQPNPAPVNQPTQPTTLQEQVAQNYRRPVA